MIFSALFKWRIRSLKAMLKDFVNTAAELGLPEKDTDFALDLLSHYEYGECFHLVIAQLYEFDIKITNEFYETIKQLANKMKYSASINHMQELVQ
ncbi:MafI family immunity protein [Mucilaginibacter limnophilus]|uniref:MafI family immunity protein n=1 Tax=Mucilaginibacter limnophilus TaxID=1932778 RepID=A0A3S2UQG5_9SPHI|nr:MafI family immunity protein [Mucilaginibacter limnophilus]RVU01970.1 MafI family immunity protein [Mucilaginibacter limnophilus]